MRASFYNNIMEAYTYYDPAQDAWVLYVPSLKNSFIPRGDHMNVRALEEAFYRAIPGGWIIPSWYAHPFLIT